MSNLETFVAAVRAGAEPHEFAARARRLALIGRRARWLAFLRRVAPGVH